MCNITNGQKVGKQAHVRPFGKAEQRGNEGEGNPKIRHVCSSCLLDDAYRIMIHNDEVYARNATTALVEGGGILVKP